MPYDFSRVRALLCDDSKQMRRLVAALLREVGLVDIHEAEDGDDAWEKIGRLKPQLLILDWNMGDRAGPAGDGLALVQALRKRKDSPDRYLPIMMLTGYTEKHRVEQARNCGVNDLVAKPVTAATLFRHLYAMAQDDRDFIVTTTYFGPDRRVRQLAPPDGTPKRTEDMVAEENAQP